MIGAVRACLLRGSTRRPSRLALSTMRASRSALQKAIAWSAVGALSGCVATSVPPVTAPSNRVTQFFAQRELGGIWGEQWGLAEFWGRSWLDQDKLVLSLDSARFDRFPSVEKEAAIEVRIILVADERDAITAQSGFVTRLAPDFLPWHAKTRDSVRGVFGFDGTLEYSMLIDCRSNLASMRPVVELKRGIGFAYAQGPDSVVPRLPQCGKPRP
jgi:hypothetical protein